MIEGRNSGDRTKLGLLFFAVGAAMSIWFVPLTVVLEAHGFGAVRPYAFATSALAAFVSPLVFGGLADRSASPLRVMRGLALATSVSMSLASVAIQGRAPVWVVLPLIQVHALCAAPLWSIASTVVFARLSNSQREFGPIRAMATLGWMAGCWVVSALGADSSSLAGYTGSIAWLIVYGITYRLGEAARPGQREVVPARPRLGWETLELMKNRDHRVVLVMIALFSIPLAAFYPYTPLQLLELGLERTSAWMSLGHITEIIAMLILGSLLSRWRLKWIFAAGLGLGVARFALGALHHEFWLLVSVFLHGASFTLVYITAQIYLDQRVEPGWRARAQALGSVMNTGVGNLAGYLGTGWWFQWCHRSTEMDWSLFWGGITILTLGVFFYFALAYRGMGRGLKRI